jgi:peptidoglycan/LPS O-acetylase OafA/YrhL
MPKNGSLQFLRAVAAIFVFLWHLHTQLGIKNHYSYALLGMGSDLFLCLSGYLIFVSLSRRKAGYWEFLGRRLGRIYPVFAVTLLLYVPLSQALGMERVQSAVHIAANALLVPLAFGVTPIITVSWTLAMIATFYLVAPIVHRLPRPYRILVYGIIGVLLHDTRAISILCGVVLWEIKALHTVRTRWLIVAFAVFVVIRCWPIWERHMTVRGLIAAITLSLVLRVQLSAVPVAIIWFSDATYSWYLMHGPALLAVFRFLRGLNAVAMHFVAFGAALGATAIMYCLVESPLRNRSTVRIPQPGASALTVWHPRTR